MAARIDQATPGCGLAYIDWQQQECGIAAALAGDPLLMDPEGVGTGSTRPASVPTTMQDGVTIRAGRSLIRGKLFRQGRIGPRPCLPVEGSTVDHDNIRPVQSDVRHERRA